MRGEGGEGRGGMRSNMKDCDKKLHSHNGPTNQRAVLIMPVFSFIGSFSLLPFPSLSPSLQFLTSAACAG